MAQPLARAKVYRNVELRQEWFGLEPFDAVALGVLLWVLMLVNAAAMTPPAPDDADIGALLLATLEEIPVGVSLTALRDGTFHRIYANRALAGLLGLSPEELQHFAQPGSSRARSSGSMRHRPRSVHLIFPIHLAKQEVLGDHNRARRHDG